MNRLSHKTILYGAAGGLGGSAAWIFILWLSAVADQGLLTEIMLGALAGMFIGAFIWSHEALSGRQYGTAMKRAAYGAVAGLFGGAAGAGLGNTAFAALSKIVADFGGFTASLGMALSVALGWAILGAIVGLCGGLVIRSRERALYGLFGGALGGLFGGALFYELSATSIWSALAGLMFLGMSIGAFISLVEEAFVSATLKVVKGRHLGRAFPLLKDVNVIGRDDRSDVCLSGAEGVGLEHAVIKRNKGHFSIETEEQGKAVYVNQKMTRSSSLTDGDVVRVGSVLLLFTAVKRAADTVVAKAPAMAAIMLLTLFGFAGAGMAAQADGPLSLQITQFDLGNFPMVKAYVSALDANGRPIQGMAKDQVTIMENGHAVSIDSLQPAGRRDPLSIAIVLDRSGSMTGEKIEQAKASVLRFITLMEPGDRAALFSFSDKVDALEPLTDNLDLLRKDVMNIEPSGHTALFDAIARGVESLSGVTGRRAVIVLTDGIANRGALELEQAVEIATKAYVSVTVIGLGQDVRTARLEGIAKDTGGTYYYAPLASGLADIYSTISNRIHNEYVITYHTQKRADYLRSVTMTLGTGERTVRAYFQPESSLFGAGGRPPAWAFAIPLLSILGFVAMSLREIEHQYQTGHLSVVRGRGTKKDIDIGSTVTIGRDERNTLGLFRDQDISQQHAEVILENDRYVIEDKGSETGTLVNKKPVTKRQVLEDGDVINVGNSTIVFSEQTTRTCACGSSLRTGAKFCAQCGMKTA
jgi:VWFA-related protein